MAVVEEDNTHLKEYVENLRSDIDSLLKLSARARDSGVWDPHDLSWCEVTFEQVFGGEEERPGPSPRQPVTVRKVSRGSHQSSELYDSRQVPVSPFEPQTKVRDDFTITEKTPTMAFSWLKAPTSTFTFKILLRHFAKCDSKHSK